MDSRVYCISSGSGCCFNGQQVVPPGWVKPQKLTRGVRGEIAVILELSEEGIGPVAFEEIVSKLQRQWSAMG